MRRIEVTDFGARGDNNSDATAGFEAAIAAAARHSTGHTLIRVPPGTYRVYPLSLASRMTLHLAAGATLLGMPFDVAARPWTQQPALPNWSRSRGGAILLRNGSGERVLVQRNESKALLHGADLDDVGVSGEGPSSMIEMHGWDWWGKRETGVERGWNGTRPHLMRFVRSRGVRVMDVQLLNSPYWNCHFWACDRVHVRGVRVVSPLDQVNTDGWDPDSSTNVLIEDSSYEGGDDCVSIKSGWDCFGAALGRPAANITLRNLACKGPRAGPASLGADRRGVIRASLTPGSVNSTGIAIGSELSGGVHDVLVERIRFVDVRRKGRTPQHTATRSPRLIQPFATPQAGRMAHLKTGRTRGGAVSSVRFANLTAVGRMDTGIVLDATFKPNSKCGRGWAPRPTHMSDISFVDIDASGAAISGYSFDLGARHKEPVRSYVSAMELFLKDVHLPRGTRGSWRCGYVTSLLAKRVSPKPRGDECGVFTRRRGLNQSLRLGNVRRRNRTKAGRLRRNEAGR